MVKGLCVVAALKRATCDWQEEPLSIIMFFWSLESWLSWFCQLFSKMVFESAKFCASLPKLPLMPQQPVLIMFRLMLNFLKISNQISEILLWMCRVLIGTSNNICEIMLKSHLWIHKIKTPMQAFILYVQL